MQGPFLETSRKPALSTQYDDNTRSKKARDSRSPSNNDHSFNTSDNPEPDHRVRETVASEVNRKSSLAGIPRNYDLTTRTVINQNNIMGNNQPSSPVVASSGGNFFTGAQNVFVTGSQLVGVQGNYYSQTIHHSLVSPDILPPLPPLRHSSAMFTGRGIYLERLKDYFGYSAKGQRKSFLLHGMGGIGKTQICFKFIEEHETLFSDIFWIDASSESMIDLRLKQIAQANSGTAEAASSAASALKWISKRFNWLMIYDNADDGYQVVEKFLPPGNGGNILITSRKLELMRITENSMEVLEMGEEEALSLLSKSAKPNYASENIQTMAKQLVSMLGGIPLAIDQAGAYMLTCKCPLDDYLELYAKNHNQLMSNPLFEGASDYGSCTYGTWEMSMKEIEARAAQKSNPKAIAAESAITLYQIIAFLHHENIPGELFKNAAENYKKRNIDKEKESGLPLSITMLNPKVLFLDEKGEWNKMQFQLGIQVLLSFSLIKSSGNLYSVHPLVHAWSRNRVPKMEIAQQFLMTKAILGCSMELDYKIDNYEYCALLAPHIRTINAQAALLNLNTFYYDDECNQFSLVFHQIGSWNELEKLRIWMLERRKATFVPKHPFILNSMAHLASIYGKQGRWDEAEKLEVEVMEARKEKLGSQHPHTLSSMSNLASTYGKQGRWDEAEKLEVEVMEARKEKLGSQHPHTLTVGKKTAPMFACFGKIRMV
ncbi:P-loop containing nucleoside triphosphate hydrolase protein [Amanita rubescens]|nr:P-loop containing nucleoside triphosphate hydrolase protein [Amanita rubescens]